MATTEGLVPITRAYLARYYDKYPLAPLPDAATDLAARLRALSADLAAVTPIASGERLRPLSLIFTRDPLLSFPRWRIISTSSPFFSTVPTGFSFSCTGCCW